MFWGLTNAAMGFGLPEFIVREFEKRELLNGGFPIK
jgi:hypothetical protein